jgi:DNA-binding MarR family transcriptional regulator
MTVTYGAATTRRTFRAQRLLRHYHRALIDLHDEVSAPGGDIEMAHMRGTTALKKGEAMATDEAERGTTLRTQLFKAPNVLICWVEDPPGGVGVEFHINDPAAANKMSVLVPFTREEWHLIEAAIRKAERIASVSTPLPTPLTVMQKTVLNWVKVYTTENGCSPTVREIAAGLSLSPANIQQHLRRLEAKETLVLTGRHRGIVLLNFKAQMVATQVLVEASPPKGY